MSIATEGEICYAAGSYYSVGFSQATKAQMQRGATAPPPSVRQKLAELLSSAAKLNGAARPAPMRPSPDETFAIPMRERYLGHKPSAVKVAAPPLTSPAIALPAPAWTPGQTLISMTARQMKALPLDEFRARFEATDPNELRPAHIILIDGDKDLSAIAHDVLDRKAREKALTASQAALVNAQIQPRENAQDALQPIQSEPGVTCVGLPKQLDAFIAEQIKAGLYRDAGEVICDSLRFFQAETRIHFLRIALERETAALERETTALARARERRASELDATARAEAG
jgi:putative addiction module CopG family antidote